MIRKSDYVESDEACLIAGVCYPTIVRCLKRDEITSKMPKGIEPRLVRSCAGSRGGRKAYWHKKFLEAVKEHYYAFA